MTWKHWTLEISGFLLQFRFFWKPKYYLFPRLVNQRLLEVQSQVEELQKSLQDQGSKAEDVSRNVHETYIQVVTIFETFIFL